jgi:hypothetical protein
VPQGRVSEASNLHRITFLEIKDRAKELLALYESCGLKMSSASGLAKLIQNAITLSDRWLANDMADMTMVNAFQAMQLLRIAEAALPLTNVTGRNRYLNRLMSGELDSFQRGPSAAKDTLWELELWALLKGKRANAVLKDPPDIVLHLGGSSLGIACKKVYSQRNVEKALSEAVSQVEHTHDVGVAALNVDELTPAHTVLKVRRESEMSRILQGHCVDFLRQHQKHFHKYLSTGRLIAAFVSVHVIADIQEWDAQFNNCRQSTVWVVPNLPPNKTRLLREFERIALER